MEQESRIGRAHVRPLDHLRLFHELFELGDCEPVHLALFLLRNWLFLRVRVILGGLLVVGINDLSLGERRIFVVLKGR